MKKFLAILLLVCACGSSTDNNATNNADNNQNGKDDSSGEDSTMCVGVRGNGARIFAHFGALARIHEEYGPIDGIAGGSSASITGFLVESIYMNPALTTCGDETCSDEVIGVRVALMLKSISGYLEVLSQTDEAVALMQLKGVADIIASEQATIDQLLLDEDFEGARQAVITVLENEEIVSLVNPEIVALLQTSENPEFHVADIWGAVSSFGSFSTDSDLILLRPGLISFESFANKVGRIGTFYAAMGPDNLAAWDAWFEACGEASAGKFWPELEGVQATEGLTCQDMFRGMVDEWRTEYLADEASQPTRLDDPVGLGLTALISTSVITGDSVQAFADARNAYLQGAPISLDVNFDDVQFGYWGQPSDLETVGNNDEGYADLKTEKFMGLGSGPWREALSLSPAEPGLTRALEIDDQNVSAGGWSDLAPTTVLKNVGCDNVILVTREGEVQGGFGPSVAALLGMDADDDDALYNLDGESSINTSLSAADGVWCTNWDGVTNTDFAGAFLDAYTAPFETSAERFTEGDNVYDGAVESVNKPACSPGVAASAAQ